MPLQFIPIHHKEDITIINSYGFIGVVNLWSKREYAINRFHEAEVDLAPETSSISAFGNLYGNGLKHLLINLLYNPQIEFLLVCGSNRSGSQEEISNFFDHGVSLYEQLGVSCNLIKGTKRTLPKTITPDLFTNTPRIINLDDIKSESFLLELKTLLPTLMRSHSSEMLKESDRKKIDLPEVNIQYFPSNPIGHTIIKDTPIEAWKEILFCLNRFGHYADLGKKGKRIELLNVKAIVNNPGHEDNELLESCGFSVDTISKYCRELIDGQERADLDYTYGNRIRSYFGCDGLTECIKKLKANKQNRRAYIVLWDSKNDLTVSDRSAPCLTTIYFRLYDDKLTLTATFRVHNALDAWLRNLYGLMKIQDYVSEETAIEKGPVTVVSHSISINPNDYDRVLEVVRQKEKKLEFEEDPNGQFRIAIEEGKIVLRHIYKGETIGEYKSGKAERIQYELKRNRAISDIGHAIYIGRQLSKAERCLQAGEIFTED